MIALEGDGGGGGDGDATILSGKVVGCQYSTMMSGNDDKSILFGSGGAMSSEPVAGGTAALGVVAVVTAAAPMSDCGVTTASLGDRMCGANRGNEVTNPRALDRPAERPSCTLVQLSTRYIRTRLSAGSVRLICDRGHGNRMTG